MWWVRTSQSWRYPEILVWFLEACWDFSPAAYAAGLLQRAIKTAQDQSPEPRALGFHAIA